MTRTLTALTLAALLAACSGTVAEPPPAPVFGGTYSQSVGFTGIGNEPY